MLSNNKIQIFNYPFLFNSFFPFLRTKNFEEKIIYDSDDVCQLRLNIFLFFSIQMCLFRFLFSALYTYTYWMFFIVCVCFDSYIWKEYTSQLQRICFHLLLLDWATRSLWISMKFVRKQNINVIEKKQFQMKPFSKEKKIARSHESGICTSVGEKMKRFKCFLFEKKNIFDVPTDFGYVFWFKKKRDSMRISERIHLWNV